jgi:hypothetical protein
MRLRAFALFPVALAGCFAAVETPKPQSCPMTPCPSGNGAYGFCVGATFSGCHYVTSDGSEFDCTSCGDCGEAARQALAWCGAPVDPGPSPPVPPVSVDGGVSGADAAPAHTPDLAPASTPDAGDACTACVQHAEMSSCAQATNGCANDPACTQLATCLDMCAANDATCINDCYNAEPPSAGQELDTLGTCLCSACAQQCVGQC